MKIELIISIVSLLISLLLGGGILTNFFLNAPKLDIENPGIKELPGNQFWRLQITMLNKGGRPISDLYGEIYIIDRNLKNKPQITNFSVANQVYPNTPTPYYNDQIQLYENMEPIFILLKINYKDYFIPHSRIFFMKWDGTINGTFSPDFTHVSKEEKEKIIDYLRKIK